MNDDEQSVTPSAAPDGDILLDTKGKRPAFFESADVDALMTALLETMSQLWATRGQVRTLQQILIDKAVVTEDELAQFNLPDIEKQKDQQSMQDFFTDAFRAMGASFQSVDSRQKAVDDFQNYKATREKS